MQAWNPSSQEVEQEEQEFEASLCYLLSPAWTARDFYFKKVGLGARGRIGGDSNFVT